MKTKRKRKVNFGKIKHSKPIIVHMYYQIQPLDFVTVFTTQHPNKSHANLYYQSQTLNFVTVFIITPRNKFHL